ncbi:hypothetical protein [Chryseobacterium sp. IT-36CA2]|uniref:hypothetical protein n=1 Tax=Chryseobacterium sp. IT-36CA2 TaxID=3026460 RepID=UPI0039E04F4E
MKTKIVLLFLLGWVGMVYGQEKNISASKIEKEVGKQSGKPNRKSEKHKDQKNQEIIYNFSTGEFEKSVIKPRQKVPTVLKIKNINTYFYDIQIQSKDININSEGLYETSTNAHKTAIIKIDTTAVLGILDTKSINAIPVMPNATNNNTSGLEEIKKKEEALASNKNALQESSKSLNESEVEKKELESIDILKKDINAIQSLPDSLKAKNISLLSTKQKELSNLANKYSNKSIDSINKEIAQKKSDIEVKKSNVFIAESVLDRELLKLKDKNEILLKVNDGIFKLNIKYFELDTEFTDVLKIAGAYNNFIYKIYRPGINKGEYKKIKSPEEKFETVAILNSERISEYYTQLKKFNRIYSEFQSVYNQIMHQNILLMQDQNEELMIIKLTLQNEFGRIKNVTDQMLKKVEDMSLSTKLSSVEIYNRELQNDETFVYVSDPIQGLGDYIEFDVTIKPKTEFKEVFAKNQNRRFKYSEYLRGGIRYDFSVGTVFDFVNKDEFYENRNNTIAKTSNNKYYPTLAGLFHVSLRSSSLCSVGFSLGASLNITEFDINSLFIGPSLLVGKKEKIIFTSGMSFRKTKQLKSGYSDGQQIVGESNIDNYLTNNFRLGFFVGISYNLTKKQKSSLKIAGNEQ